MLVQWSSGDALTVLTGLLNRFSNNGITDGTVQNSRSGPQNAGLEPAADKDKLLRKDRPQYTTINRSRAAFSPSKEEPAESSGEDDQSNGSRASASRVDDDVFVATPARPLQYVNIRRPRPSTSDTADDTASRNALFERVEPYVTVSETPNSLDVVNARRENIPEYVTIRRQRPTTEETSTVQYEKEDIVLKNTALEKEISSQPQYTSIVRARSTTLPTIEEASSPEPTTVLAVQISSFLNSLNSDANEDPELETVETEATEVATPTTTTAITTTTTTTTTSAPSTTAPRRTVLRRRGSTSTTTSTPTTTQVSSKNYSFVRRRRPLSRPNEIAPDSEEASDNFRKIRSTTPDSRETEKTTSQNIINSRRTRIKTTRRNEDSVPAAASPVERGSFRPQLSRDEVVSLTPKDSEKPQFVQKDGFAQRNQRRFRVRTSTTLAETAAEDSEASAATVEVRRPNILPRGRSKYKLTTLQPVEETSVITESTVSQRRPAFVRFTPRPFGRPSSTTTEDELTVEKEVSLKPPQRLPFVRASSLSLQGRKLPFPSRSTTEQTLTNDDENIDEDLESKSDDIDLSETAIAEKEHEDSTDEVETPKRRIIIKKLRVPSSTTENIVSIENSTTDESGKRKFRVIRRRPASTTTTEAIINTTEAESSSSPTIPKVRRIIRKKVVPIESEPEMKVQSIGLLDTSLRNAITTEAAINYGEKSRETLTSFVTEIPSTKTEKQDIIPETANEDIDETSNSEIKDVNSKDDIIVTTELNTTPESIENEVKENQEVIVQTADQSLSLSENEKESVESKESDTDESAVKTTTTSTTQITSPSTRSRLPYRPPKRIFTSTTESSLPSSSRTFSRKYNPGVYTSPATADKSLDSIKPITRRPLLNSKIFTRRPFAPFRTTKKIQEEIEQDEYSDEHSSEIEQDNPFVLVPQNQFYSRKPTNGDDEENIDEYDDETEELAEEEDVEIEPPQNKYSTTSRNPIFTPRIINSNTFRATSSSTTEIPQRQFGSIKNRTGIFSRFGANKPVSDNKKRVQNVPIGYNSPVNVASQSTSIADEQLPETTTVDQDLTTTDSDLTTYSDDDEYLSMTESNPVVTVDSTLATNNDDSISKIEGIEMTTIESEIQSTNTDDYLEFTESSTYYPTTKDMLENTQTINTINTEITTKGLPQTTTNIPSITPIVKTQYNKLFSISRVVEVSSKLDKHRLNKNNETTLVEEGKIMIEKKPTVDKIGEVSRFSLIKIFEDEIPLYLTKLGHVYPVENPPDNLIRIDEARNARALGNFADAPRENLIASESINEAYRHLKNLNQGTESTNKNHVEHLTNDDFLSFINEDKIVDKTKAVPTIVSDISYTPEWQFIPAAYEKESNGQFKSAKSYEVVTPRSVQYTDPSTLSLQSLFKTENPITARKVGDSNKIQPFVVYSAPIPANDFKPHIIQQETGQSIVTFAKGQEFHGSSVDETTMKYPVDLTVIPLPAVSTTISEYVTPITTTENIPTNPLLELLTTTQQATLTTEDLTTTTEIPSTTESIPAETTTQKISIDSKRSKFAFPRRPIIKSLNLTRPSPKPVKKINATVISNLNQKPNKTTGFNPNKSRFLASRSQNVPIDIRKKSTTRYPIKTFSTDSPRTTTERKLSFKPIRLNFRPTFIPRKSSTLPPTTLDT
ncbi:hypothetical protein ACJJTC_014334 [Scirpophaga incertulas]